jgi:hypothetical protein
MSNLFMKYRFGIFLSMTSLALSLSATAMADSSVTLTSVAPAGAAINSDTLITLTGSGFREDCQVQVGSHACTDFRLLSSKALTCRVADATAVELDDVQVQCTEGNAALAKAFTYFLPLQINAATIGEVSVPVEVELIGGVKPFTVTTQYGSVKMVDDSHAEVIFDRESVDGQQDTFFPFDVKDAVGNDMTALVKVYSPLAGAYKHLPVAVGPGYILPLGQLGGYNAHPLQVLSGDASLSDGISGTYNLLAGKSGLITLGASDILSHQEFSIPIVQHGYQDRLYQINLGSWGNTSPAPQTRLFWIAGDKIYVQNRFDDEKLKLFDVVGIMRLNLDGTQDANWGIGGEAVDVKKADNLNVWAQQTASDGRIYLAGERRRNGLNDGTYTYAYFVRYTAQGMVDTKFNPDLKLSNESEVTGISLRSDGKVWASAMSCVKDTTKCTSWIFLIDENGKTVKATQLQDHATQIMLTGDGKDGFYLASDISTYYLDHYSANGDMDAAFHANSMKYRAGLKFSGEVTQQLLAQGDVIFASVSVAHIAQNYDGEDNTTYTYAAVAFHADGTPNTGLNSSTEFLTYAGPLVTLDSQSRLIMADARLLPTGAYDPDFGANGKTVYPSTFVNPGYACFNSECNVTYTAPWATQSAIAPDGSIYQLSNQGNYQQALVHVVP